MEYISYNMGTRDFPDIYARALGPAALGLGHIYQANPSCPWYNYYINVDKGNVLTLAVLLIGYTAFYSVYHLVQTAHDNSLVLSYGGQGSGPHLPSTK